MNLRLSDDEAEALRDYAERSGRSMNDVARQAIREFVQERESRLESIIATIATEDAELLERLSR